MFSTDLLLGAGKRQLRSLGAKLAALVLGGMLLCLAVIFLVAAAYIYAETEYGALAACLIIANVLVLLAVIIFIVARLYSKRQERLARLQLEMAKTNAMTAAAAPAAAIAGAKSWALPAAVFIAALLAGRLGK